MRRHTRIREFLICLAMRSDSKFLQSRVEGARKRRVTSPKTSAPACCDSELAVNWQSAASCDALSETWRSSWADANPNAGQSTLGLEGALPCFKQAPFTGNVLEGMRSVVGELKIGAGNQILDRAGHHHLIARRYGSDRGGDIDSNSM